MIRRVRGLRHRVGLMLVALALVPSLLLAGLGLLAITRLSALAREQAGRAVAWERQGQLISRVQQQARAGDALLQGIASQAASLSRYLAWYYDHPEYLPEPGFLRGGSELVETPLGHRVNLPTTPVGVFVSRRTEMSDAIWDEVGMLSFVDPLLTAIRESTPRAERAWVISATGVARLYPNPGFGQAGSRVGPDYDLTRDEPFQAASPLRNPHRLPLWTAPYRDPAAGTMMVTAVAPIYDRTGQFRAVAGVDMALSHLVERVLGSAEADEAAFLIDRDGQLISATEGVDDLPALEAWARQLRGAVAPGLTTVAAGQGGGQLAYAPLPATGWVLGLVTLQAALERPAGAVEEAIAHSGRLFLVGGAAAVLLALGGATLLAIRATGLLTSPVLQLVEGSRRLAQDLSYRLPEEGPPELRTLARAFNAMAESLAESEREAVRQGRRVVEERNRLAREIHDTIAQGLAGIVLHLETVGEILAERPEGPERQHLERAVQLARESLAEARRSVWDLRPSAVEESGLPAALAHLAEGMRADGFDCVLAVDEGAPLGRLTPAGEDALYRACQEALANVRKHSGATRVTVRLAGGVDRVSLVVSDDGRGFAADRQAEPRPEGGYGLWAMRERLEQVGGGLMVRSRPGAGTRLEAWAPAAGKGE